MVVFWMPSLQHTKSYTQERRMQQAIAIATITTIAMTWPMMSNCEGRYTTTSQEESSWPREHMRTWEALLTISLPCLLSFMTSAPPQLRC